MLTLKKYNNLQNLNRQKLGETVRKILKSFCHHTNREKYLSRVIRNNRKYPVKIVKKYKSNPQIGLTYQKPLVSKHRQTILGRSGKVSFQIRIDKYYRLTTVYIGYKKHPGNPGKYMTYDKAVMYAKMGRVPFMTKFIEM